MKYLPLPSFFLPFILNFCMLRFLDAEISYFLITAYSLTQLHDVVSHMSPEGLQITSCNSSSQPDQAVGIFTAILPHVYTTCDPSCRGVFRIQNTNKILSVLLCISMWNISIDIDDQTLSTWKFTLKSCYYEIYYYFKVGSSFLYCVQLVNHILKVCL